MPIQIEIPDSIADAIRLPENRIRQELLVELSLSLYAQEILSFGKARAMCHLSKYEFGQLLGKRQIERHYGAVELDDDFNYANGQ